MAVGALLPELTSLKTITLHEINVDVNFHFSDIKAGLYCSLSALGSSVFLFNAIDWLVVISIASVSAPAGG